jgi:hypothetical protein
MEENSKFRTTSLSRASNTFTSERLALILQNERFPHVHIRHAGVAWGGLKEIRCEINTDCFEFERVGDEGLRAYGNEKTKLRAIEFCKQLYGHDERDDDSSMSIAVTDLNTMMAEVFGFKFEPLKESQRIIEQACGLLERMPACPLELMDTPMAVPLEYRAASVVDHAPRDARIWEQLQVTTYVSDTVLRVALAVIMEQGIEDSLLDLINIVATLLEIVSQLEATIADAGTAWRSFVVRAFLWSTWQRCQLIYFHKAASRALIEGSLDGKKGDLVLRGTMSAPDVSIYEMSRRYAGLSKPSYMCSWNFELLRINPVCIGADFRRFFQRYNAAFGDYAARCIIGRSHACKGDSPHSCQRFHGMVIEDQSAHDRTCSKDCRQLIWDEVSYRSLSGARALCLMQSDDSFDVSIRYRNASDQTLAISHVWSQ